MYAGMDEYLGLGVTLYKPFTNLPASPLLARRALNLGFRGVQGLRTASMQSLVSYPATRQAPQVGASWGPSYSTCTVPAKGTHKKPYGQYIECSKRISLSPISIKDRQFHPALQHTPTSCNLKLRLKAVHSFNGLSQTQNLVCAFGEWWSEYRC